MNGTLDSTGSFGTKSYGKLETNTTFNVFGWGGELDNPRRDPVTVLRSQFCNPQFPQAYCSIFAGNNSICSAKLGSPILKGDASSASIDGFLISEGYCTSNGSQFILNYHSVDDFKDWIKKTSGAESLTKLSMVLILSAFLISFL